MHERTEIARSAAGKLQAAGRSLASLPALVGFDGFIDSITRLVRTRRSMDIEDYEPIGTITELSERIAAAAGLSANIERVTIEDRFGGNGPLMAGALGRLGLPVTYVGAVGDGAIHPTFTQFASRCERVCPIGPHSHTVCLEFEDGKVMMNDTRAVQAITWERLIERVTLAEFTRFIDRARLLGIVNWSLMGGVPGIWRGIIRDVLPHISHADRRLFIDLSDPAKRTDADIGGMLAMLGDIERAGLRVSLGLNLSEATRISQVLGCVPPRAGQSEAIRAAAAAIRERVCIDTVVVHPREGAACAAREGAPAWFDGPFTSDPKLSTGAGDHFNAGFAFAQGLGLEAAECLATGCAVSGAYVRDAESPTLQRVVAFLADLPAPDR